MATAVEYPANITRKRPFTAPTTGHRTLPAPPSPFKIPTVPASRSNPRASPSRRRFPSNQRCSNMPTIPARETAHVQIPSFMSVYGEDATMTDILQDGMSTSQTSKLPPVDGTMMASEGRYHIDYQHRGSTTSTSNSESTDSSPTTTVSTADSSTMTDPSPSSSPESPSSVPLASFGYSMTKPASDDMTMSPPLSPGPGYNQPLSPGKKPRNMKNLSLNMAAPTRQAPRPPLRVKTASAVAASLPQSAPPSPSFVLPHKPPRKRPSNLGLTIQTPSTNTSPDVAVGGLRIVPPTPGLSNTLRHHQSSPSLSLFSPSVGSSDRLPMSKFPSLKFARPRHAQSLSQNSSLDSVPSISEAHSPASSRLDELEEEDDIEPPLSQEVKSPAYPAGPVCIYDPSVYLYLEPTSEEASQYDVILNVAREVHNPFDKKVANGEKETMLVTSEVRDMALDSRDDIAEPASATSSKSFETAPESLPSGEDPSPLTPRPSHSLPTVPEYIHIPWDHNTNIVDDLFRLVELVDDRVRQGKRVLIHCQCGVSRSASLIVAYGLYKDPSLTVQEAYDAVKSRSRWIGPNMSLIYQLSEFRTKLIKDLGMAPSGPRSQRSRGMLGLMGNVRSNTVPTGSPTNRSQRSRHESFDAPRAEPQTAPLPDDKDRTPVRTSPRDIGAPSRGEADSLDPIVPSSAPPDISWIESHGGSWGSSQLGMGFGAPPLPADAVFQARRGGERASWGCQEDEPSIMSPREMEFTANPFHRDLSMKPAFPVRPPTQIIDEVPPTPSLMSPRAVEFTANPFHRNAAAEAATSFGFTTMGDEAMAASMISNKQEDPRSPATRGEAPIVRSILDVL
ncbi:MAG: hypothetical protein M1817_004802 [Caeruleum heppii]|nr:MAG: hypothetical protein M1817_004802 [Caeruleum heppii]